MQLCLASHHIDGLVEKNVTLMLALDPPARAAYAETRADLGRGNATGKCALVRCTLQSTLVLVAWCRCCWCPVQERVH